MNLIVSDGEVPYDKRFLAPGISPDELETVADPILLKHNIPVFRWDDRILLIDAGNGYCATPYGGQLRSKLKAAGIAAEQVTDVVLTHAHPDHLGGLIDIHHRPAFPGAQVHISKMEHDFWQSKATDFSKSKNAKEELLEVQQQIQQMLEVVRAQLVFFDETSTLPGFLRPIPAPGHTPGHTMFEVSAGDQQFIHMADICHEESVLFNKPEWGTIFDIDFELAAATRRNVLNDFANSGMLILGYHMPYPGFGRVVRRGDGFAWAPEKAPDY
ncbi:MAG: MBL fold metallo-hydrolase [Chitinophaga sp.]|uniref:MBL fold metallo-hydrolase n=1 Tax=Chitinophaga sp. TaxID=1869181 RepID=UPI001B1F4CCD|nr:MBL fold metallo-hydrolase [Chitinophaga sp.]MBO9729858.1 MBL fold metallo-hydrolase [Chitinophaga sp.]